MQKAKQTYCLSFFGIAFILFLLLGIQFEGNASQRASTALSSQVQEIHQYQSSRGDSCSFLATGQKPQSILYSSRSSDHRLPFSLFIAVENEQNIENKKGDWTTVYRTMERSVPTLINKPLLSKSGLKYIPIKKLSLTLLSTVVFLH